eukprot:30999-Ditylum_brightwellii.AAC.3
MVAGDHQELDDFEVLNSRDYQKYQMLIGMLNWIVILGCLDVACTMSSLACFVDYTCKGHVARTLNTFGYLKKKLKRRIRIDHCK